MDTAIPLGETEPVFAIHPIPGERQCCPASGLTADEIDLPSAGGSSA